MAIMQFGLALVTLAVALLTTVAQADYVVFVHGFIGFGPDELLGVGYWGFPKIFGSGQDYIAQMKARGHKVLYASVGPLSSNWDRACELWAQIMGTRVDYGLTHSTKNNHTRYGKDYTNKGFFPGWDGRTKIHFVTHSMGGNTVRLLEYLIHNGAPEEEAATGDSTSLLFKKNKPFGSNWIQSIFTIAAPHDGTTLQVLAQNLLSFSKETLLAYGAVAGLTSLNVDWLYDFDLEQFGLGRQQGEMFLSYFNRIYSSDVFKDGFVDNALYDLGMEASSNFNNKTELTFPGTYYFSYTTSQTFGCDSDGDHCPDFQIELWFAPTAYTIGHIGNTCTTINKAQYCFSRAEWAENDGVVPRRSSRTPKLGVRNFVEALAHPTKCFLFKCQYDNSNLLPGVWYTRHIHRDHGQAIGLRLNLLEPDATGGAYSNIADTIDAIRVLPASLEQEPPQTAPIPTENSNSSEGQVNAAAIAAPVSIGVLLAGVLAAVAIRKRRSKSVPETEASRHNSVVAFSSTSANPRFGVQMQTFSAGHMEDGSSAA